MSFLQTVVVLEIIVALALIGGRLVFRRTGSTLLGALAGLMLALVPWWDLIPGGYAYVAHVRADGGTRIHQTVEVRDFLHTFRMPPQDAEQAFRLCIANRACYEGLLDRRQAVEMISEPRDRSVAAVVRLSVVKEPDPRCSVLAEFSKLKTAEFWTIGKDDCFAVDLLAAPASRFDVGFGRTELGRLSYVLERTRESVVERVTQRVLADRVDYWFSTWPDAPWPAMRLHLDPPQLDFGAVLKAPR